MDSAGGTFGGGGDNNTMAPKNGQNIIVHI